MFAKTNNNNETKAGPSSAAPTLPASWAPTTAEWRYCPLAPHVAKQTVKFARGVSSDQQRGGAGRCSASMKISRRVNLLNLLGAGGGAAQIKQFILYCLLGLAWWRPGSAWRGIIGIYWYKWEHTAEFCCSSCSIVVKNEIDKICRKSGGAAISAASLRPAKLAAKYLQRMGKLRGESGGGWNKLEGIAVMWCVLSKLAVPDLKSYMLTAVARAARWEDSAAQSGGKSCPGINTAMLKSIFIFDWLISCGEILDRNKANTFSWLSFRVKCLKKFC